MSRQSLKKMERGPHHASSTIPHEYPRSTRSGTVRNNARRNHCRCPGKQSRAAAGRFCRRKAVSQPAERDQTHVVALGPPPTNAARRREFGAPRRDTLVPSEAICSRNRSSPYNSPLAFMASLMPSVNIVSESPTAKGRLHC